ncbi:hypothetical protein D9611_000523 [Ephemerocybe angulata]|uniref:Hydrophobin n=1 Tax=Ephemerocybe angulata TaxID=980116 RepID=A0A8H5F6Z4_9AGAR|nr:hypothetical protein D9611_000523 [Tulosesus angulatus]
MFVVIFERRLRIAASRSPLRHGTSPGCRTPFPDVALPASATRRVRYSPEFWNVRFPEDIKPTCNIPNIPHPKDKHIVFPQTLYPASLSAMQFKQIATLAALATLAAAQCNTGPVQCCESIQHADDPAVAKLLGPLGIVIQDVTIPIGVTCSPISVIGLPGNSCSAQPVCCTNNSFNGIVAIGCTPININL